MAFNFDKWIKIFQRNADQYTAPNWQTTDYLTKREIQTISNSLRQFQIGESSEGKHLLNAAQRYLQKHEDKSYLDAITLFIKEEQRHAMTLRTFMNREGITTIRSHWVDNIFRNLRKLAGLELSVMVLLTAELIAMIYYHALSKATESQLLKQICTQILADEEQHISFQSFTLHNCWHHQHPLSRIKWKMIRLILMQSTIMVVWCWHRPVLKTGGYSFRSFAQAVMNEYTKSTQLIDTGV